MFTHKVILFRVLLAGVLPSVLSGCTTAPAKDIYAQDAFTQGQVILDCDGLACASDWQWKSRALHSRYQRQEWDDLARDVTNLQYGSDLAYFYLGSAAEGMGSLSAAKVYFDRVETAPHRCADGIFTGCGDIRVAEEAKRRSDELAAELVESLAMDLVEAQSRLKQLGFYTAAVDGISGPRTIAAVKQFQTSQGINASGELTAETMLALAGSNTAPSVPERASSRASGTKASGTKASATPAAATQMAGKDDAGAVAPIARSQPVKSPAAMPKILPPGRSSAPGPMIVEGPVDNNQGNTLAKEGERTRLKIAAEVLADADPFAQSVIVVEQGAWVTIINRGLEWSKISYKGAIGYVYSDSLQ